ncbi:MAG: arsenic resistance protein [Geobacteraceae bacterium]|nr:arsenic resistance protein [Geobacteraceae bacterium]NTW81609.1 arsenic resistance protein [Geobacteraceae bacterium]
MWRILTAINKNLTLAIPVTMMVGFAYGVLGDTTFLKYLIIPFTFLMVYPMMVTLKIRSVLEGGDTRAQLMTQAINFLVIPFVAYGIGKAFFADRPFLALGLLLASLVPTSGMTISWTGFAKGNLAAAVKMTVVGLILGSLLTPLYIRFLMGAQVDVDMVSVMKQILVVVFLPMLAGYATQRWAVKQYGQKPFQELIAPRFPALSTIGVLGIVFIAIALKARSVADSPALLVTILLPLLLLYLCNYLFSTLVGKVFLNRGDAIALVYGTVMRNLSIALAVSMNAFGKAGSEAALVIALAYIIQVQSAAWYVKLTDKVFGAKSAA